MNGSGGLKTFGIPVRGRGEKSFLLCREGSKKFWFTT